MRDFRVIALLLALLISSGCARQAAPPSAATPLPTAIPYHWDERAAITLIRADRMTVPLSEADAAARVPDCAVFGDGRVRWVEAPEDGAALGRLYESLVDRAALAELLPRVVESGFFDLEPVYGPDLGPVRELAIRVEGLGMHTVQVASITPPPEAFDALYEACAALRQPEAAAEVIPTGGWIHVYPVREPGAAPQPWPADAPQLGALAEQPRWYDNPALIGAIWAAQRDYGVEATYTAGFAASPQSYRVIVRAEGITLDTPRAPREQGAPLPITTPWLPSPNERVFTAWLEGGLPTGHANLGPLVVPACTVFGDGRVIISDQPRGMVEVGTLSEQQMTGFIEGWLNTGFFSGAGADPTPALENAVQQVVTITLLDDVQATRTYPLNTTYLTGAPNPCADLTTFEPFVPESGYLRAEALGPVAQFEADGAFALVGWPEGFPLLGHLSEARWFGTIEDNRADTPPEALPIGVTPTAPPRSDALPVDGLRFAWEHAHGGRHSQPNVLFTQQGLAYALTFNIPRITIER
ncbi:MAG: hypothetical protein JXN59_00155 [Anaerolineae bacterium]|nr:hypothetical protein [Anaerolineae bacterium]